MGLVPILSGVGELAPIRSGVRGHAHRRGPLEAGWLSPRHIFSQFYNRGRDQPWRVRLILSSSFMTSRNVEEIDKSDAPRLVPTPKIISLKCVGEKAIRPRIRNYAHKIWSPMCRIGASPIPTLQLSLHVTLPS